jgi:hypothetical protein
MTSSKARLSAWHTARRVPNVGRRRPAKRSHSVPSSTWASRPSSRRVQPLSTRARSILTTSTDQNRDDLIETGSRHPECRNALQASPPQKQWNARCYAFRAFRPADNIGSHLLGAPDRQSSTPDPAVGSSPITCPRRQLTACGHAASSATTGSRYASRARVRARARGGTRVATPTHQWRRGRSSTSPRRRPEVRHARRAHRR